LNAGRILSSVQRKERRGAMKFPEYLLYTDTHEWVKNEGNQVTIGLTDYAQNQLKDIVYVELPGLGSDFKRGESIGVVESVKTAADLFSPVSGKVTETNVTLKDSPQFVNEDPYGRGWILKMELRDKGELKGLLTSEAYQGSLPKEE
jgi:glycine cleavage system H protein